MATGPFLQVERFFKEKSKLMLVLITNELNCETKLIISSLAIKIFYRLVPSKSVTYDVSGELLFSFNMLTELLTFFMLKHAYFGIFGQTKKPVNR